MHMATVTGSPSEAGLVCGHWIMPMLWSGGRTDKISNKLAGDVACLGGSMVEHQPRLLGSRVRFPAGAFAIFSVSAKASLPISLSPFPFLFLSLPLPLPSTFRLRFKIKKLLSLQESRSREVKLPKGILIRTCQPLSPERSFQRRT